MSCKNSLSIEAIKKEYNNIKEDSNIEIMSLEIIEEHEPTFEELANREFDRMKRLNGNLAQIIEAQFKIDSLLKENINQRNCFHRNAVKAYQLKYEAENREDSIRLDKEMRERINNELEYHENQLL